MQATNAKARSQTSTAVYNSLVRWAEGTAVATIPLAALHRSFAYGVLLLGAGLIVALYAYRTIATPRQRRHAVFVAFVLAALMVVVSGAAFG